MQRIAEFQLVSRAQFDAAWDFPAANPYDELMLPLLVWMAIAVTVITGVFLKYTRTGRNLYAVGSNAEAAQMRGVPINRIRVLILKCCCPGRSKSMLDAAAHLCYNIPCQVFRWQ